MGGTFNSPFNMRFPNVDKSQLQPHFVVRNGAAPQFFVLLHGVEFDSSHLEISLQGSWASKVEEFIKAEGGQCPAEWLAHNFPGIKKSNLQDHFIIHGNHVLLQDKQFNPTLAKAQLVISAARLSAGSSKSGRGAARSQAPKPDVTP